MSKLNLNALTAREIREAMPDPATLQIRPIPGKLRRELFRAIQQHDRPNFAECCNAHNVTAGNLVRDQYFQFAHVLNFPINEWLDRETKILDDARSEGRERSTQNLGRAHESRSKGAVAIRRLEAMGYAWHPPSNDFYMVNPKKPVIKQPDWE